MNLWIPNPIRDYKIMSLINNNYLFSIIGLRAQSSTHGYGIGAILVSSKGNKFSASTRLKFPYTNNIAEYEACIMNLKMAFKMGINELEAYGDSSLIIF